MKAQMMTSALEGLRTAKYTYYCDPAAVIEVNCTPLRFPIACGPVTPQAWMSSSSSVTHVPYASGGGRASCARITWSVRRKFSSSSCEKLRVDRPAVCAVNDGMQRHEGGMLADPPEHAGTSPMRFKLLSGADLCNAPPLRWMVRGVLPQEGLAALYGPSGSGKSFLALDLAAAIAGGVERWFDYRVRACPVTYVCLEGEQGMQNRVTAWCQHHGTSVPDMLRFVMHTFDLRRQIDILDLANAIIAVSGVGGLVILDTLNRAAPGIDENSSVDMSKVIAAAKHLQSLTGGLVLLVHHTGKDASKGMRGHSSLHAALDGAIEVSNPDGRREWSVAKSKDDETGSDHPFALHRMVVGVDEFGDDITSCVVLEGGADDAVKRTSMPRGENQKIALQIVDELLRQSTEYGKGGAPVECACIRLDAAIGIISQRLPTDAKHAKERAKEAVGALVARAICGTDEGWIWRV
jgi:hypothetical protein